MNTRPNTTTTHPTAATLNELFDGQPVDAAIARHARDCSSCAHQLQTLTNQRKALGRLLHRDANWMTAAQRRGRVVLGDLLAELGNACVARRDASQRSSPLSELPRPIESIMADIRTLATRLSRLPDSAHVVDVASALAATVTRLFEARPAELGGDDLETLTQRGPIDPDLLRHCSAALRALEGGTARCRALESAAEQPGDRAL